MKKIYVLLIVSIAFLWACEKKTENISEIVEIPKIELKGSPVKYLKATKIDGLTFEELGYQEEGATSSTGEKVTIINNIPKNNIKPGTYFVKYVLTTSNGVIVNKNRKIIVYDDDGILSGIYTAKLTSWSGSQFPNEEQPDEIQVVIATKLNPDGTKTYKCADLYASFFNLFLKGKYWNNGGSISPSEDIKIDASGKITGTGAAFFAIGGSTAIFNGKKIDDDNLLWITARADGNLWVKLELTKKKFN